MSRLAVAMAASGRSNSGRSTEKALPPTLRDVRHARGLSLGRVEAETGLHRGRISELERGERSPTTSELAKLAEAYDVAGWRVLVFVVLDEGES